MSAVIDEQRQVAADGFLKMGQHDAMFAISGAS